MKICIISLNGYKVLNQASSAQIGGTEIQMVTLANVLANNKKNSVHVVTGNFGQALQEQWGQLVVWRSIALSKKKLNLLISPCIFLFRLMQIKADVYISSPAGAEVGLTALYCKLVGKKYIFRLASDVDATQVKRKQIGGIGGWLYGIGIRLASSVVVQNDQQKKNLKKYYHRDAEIIPNAFAITSLDGIQKDNVLWVGSARAVKQPDILLQLAKALPHRLFVMVISSSGDTVILDRIQQSAVSISNLKLVVDVPNSEIEGSFAKAKILVGTSAYEGFPNVYIQACLASTPIISWSVDPDNFIQKNNLGFVVHQDMDALVAQTEYLLNNEVLLGEMGTRAREYAVAQHDIQKIVKKWEELLLIT